MALETGTYISDLVTTNPTSTDGVSQADDHLRLIKSTVKATFPNITGAVTATHTDLNKLTASGSPQFTTIELGNASDTTISRASSGVLAVEGGVIPKENRANTFTDRQTALGDDSGFYSRASTSAGAAYLEAQSNDYISTPTYTSTFLRQNSTSATGTTAGLSNAGLGELRFQNGTAGLIGTNGAFPLVLATASTERMRIDSSGNVGIGTSSPTKKLDVYSSGTTSTVVQARNDSVIVYLDANNSFAYLNSFSNHPLLFGTNNTERLRITSTGGVSFGSSGTAFGTTGQVLASQGNAPPVWRTPTLIESGSGGVGYGTGSGGAVTQSPSRVSAVTINKTNGRITLTPALASAGTSTSFTVNNSTVADTDTVIVNIASGASADTYNVSVTAVAAGSFRIQLHCFTTVSSTETPILNFAVIKAVAS